MAAPIDQNRLEYPFVHSELPGPRSAELLANQDRRESNARRIRGIYLLL